jgi:hypothetical protein
MRTQLVLLVLACATVALANQCRPVFSPGVSDTNVCHNVYEVQNSYWLPEAYIDNAVCACSGIPTYSYEANCIRQFLATRINDKSRYTPAFRQQMAEAKTKFNAHPLLDLISYKAFVMRDFVPKIYEDHQDAYKQCCCTGTPAFFASWEAVATVKVPTCGLVVDSIKMFGSCHGKAGTW